MCGDGGPGNEASLLMQLALLEGELTAPRLQLRKVWPISTYVHWHRMKDMQYALRVSHFSAFHSFLSISRVGKRCTCTQSDYFFLAPCLYTIVMEMQL